MPAKRLKISDILEDVITDEPIVEYLGDDPDEPDIEELLDENWEPNAVSRFPYRLKVEGYPLDHSVGCGHCFKEFTVGFKQTNCPGCRQPLISPDKAFYENPLYKEKIYIRKP